MFILALITYLSSIGFGFLFKSRKTIFAPQPKQAPVPVVPPSLFSSLASFRSHQLFLDLSYNPMRQSRQLLDEISPHWLGPQLPGVPMSACESHGKKKLENLWRQQQKQICVTWPPPLPDTTYIIHFMTYSEPSVDKLWTFIRCKMETAGRIFLKL